MAFSYSAVWDDTVRLLKANSSLLSAVAGAFIVLPALIIAYMFPPPAPAAGTFINDLNAYYVSNAPWLLAAGVLEMMGVVVIQLLLFDRQSRLTVGGAISAALALLPAYVGANILAALMIGFGSMLLILPGVYLFGRLAPLAAVFAAEGRRGPIDALRRTFDVTRGHGWVVVGLIILVALAGLLLILALTWTVGSMLILLAGERIGGFLLLVLTAFAEGGLSVVLAVLYAAIYRRLASAD